MRIVVLGGAGAMGRALSLDLAACEEVGELVVADRDERAAHELVEQSGSPRARAVGLDLEDRRAALRVLEGADALVNATSFTLFDRAIELAIEARVAYCDLISEPTPEHERRVRDAGIVAISGLGASPGLTNVLVGHAARELGPPEEAHVSWMSFRTIAPSPGLLDTILWELSDACDTRIHLSNGRFRHAGFLEGSRLVDFAPPVGRQRVYYVPHPEVRTLPRNFPSLRTCAVRGTWRPELMADVAVLNRYGLLDPESIEATKAAIWRRHGGTSDEQHWRLFVDVEVIAGERRRVYGASHPDWGSEGTGRMTGICAAVGALLLARNGGGEPGFVDPEAYFEPEEFLRELAARGTIRVSWVDGPS